MTRTSFLAGRNIVAAVREKYQAAPTSPTHCPLPTIADVLIYTHDDVPPDDLYQGEDALIQEVMRGLQQGDGFVLAVANAEEEAHAARS